MSVPPYVCGAIGLYLFAVSSDIRYAMLQVYNCLSTNSS